jgi:putative endonuclease
MEAPRHDGRRNLDLRRQRRFQNGGMQDRICAVYILTNPNRTVLYTGVTIDLATRLVGHRGKQDPSAFTARYNVTRLVYFEPFDDIVDAIAREKQIKAGSRRKKLEFIQRQNAEWRDLYEDLAAA